MCAHYFYRGTHAVTLGSKPKEDWWRPIWQVHERASFFYSTPKKGHLCGKFGFFTGFYPPYPFTLKKTKAVVLVPIGVAKGL